MLRPSAAFGVVSALAVLNAPIAVAQTGSPPPGVYEPKAAVQSPPLRVEVLDGPRFRDVESKEVYRLYGIDTCAPGQEARLTQKPWPCGTMATAWIVTATLNAWLACRTLRDEASQHHAR